MSAFKSNFNLNKNYMHQHPLTRERSSWVDAADVLCNRQAQKQHIEQKMKTSQANGAETDVGNKLPGNFFHRTDSTGNTRLSRSLLPLMKRI